MAPYNPAFAWMPDRPYTQPYGWPFLSFPSLNRRRFTTVRLQHAVGRSRQPRCHQHAREAIRLPSTPNATNGNCAQDSQ